MELVRETAPPEPLAIADVWPIFALRLRTERLELRPLDDHAIPQLAEVARRGVHDSGLSPFSSGWTDHAPNEFDVRFAQYFWSQRATWSATGWALPFGVYLDGNPVGVQQITAVEFPTLRTVGTGSWITRSYQGLGIGTEMRAAVLSLAFDHLGAELAITGAYGHAAASRSVSEKLGYENNGTRRDLLAGRAADAFLFRLTRERWSGQARPSVDVAGLEDCLHLFNGTAALRGVD